MDIRVDGPASSAFTPPSANTRTHKGQSSTEGSERANAIDVEKLLLSPGEASEGSSVHLRAVKAEPSSSSLPTATLSPEEVARRESWDQLFPCLASTNLQQASQEQPLDASNLQLPDKVKPVHFSLSAKQLDGLEKESNRDCDPDLNDLRGNLSSLAKAGCLTESVNRLCETVLYLEEQPAGKLGDCYRRTLTGENWTEILEAWSRRFKCEVRQAEFELVILQRALNAENSPLLNPSKSGRGDKQLSDGYERHGLCLILAHNMKWRKIHAPLFRMLQERAIADPELNGRLLPPPYSSEDMGKKLFRSGKTRKTMITRISDSSNYTFNSNWTSVISRFAWNAAKSFALVWGKNNTCKVGSEFNVGESDLMNSEYCYYILAMALGEKSPVPPLDKKKLAYFIDMSLQRNNVKLVIQDKEVDWRDWLLNFIPGEHSLYEGMKLRKGYVCVSERSLSEEPSISGSLPGDSPSDTTEDRDILSPSPKKPRLMSSRSLPMEELTRTETQMSTASSLIDPTRSSQAESEKSPAESLSTEPADQQMEMEALTTVLDSQEQEIQTLTARLSEQQETIETLTARSTEQQAEITTLNTHAVAKQREIEKLRNEMQSLIRDAQDQEAQSKTKLQSLEKDFMEKSELVETMRAQLLSQNQSSASARTETNQLTERIKELEATLQEKETAIDELISTQHEDNTAISELTSTVEAQRAQLQQSIGALRWYGQNLQQTAAWIDRTIGQLSTRAEAREGEPAATGSLSSALQADTQQRYSAAGLPGLASPWMPPHLFGTPPATWPPYPPATVAATMSPPPGTGTGYALLPAGQLHTPPADTAISPTHPEDPAQQQAQPTELPSSPLVSVTESGDENLVE